MQRVFERTLVWVGIILALGSCPALAQNATVDVVSSPPDLVTSGGVLIRVRGTDLRPEGWASNDTLITPFFQREDGDWYGLIGLMDLLIPGENLLNVIPGTIQPQQVITFTVTVHNPDEPLFAGPRPAPAACQNQALGLGPELDTNCGAPRTIKHIYRTTDRAWAAFPLTGDRPLNIDRTTTSDGRVVPFIVRVETGVINRSPYTTAFLHDPSAEQKSNGDLRISPSAWNGTLVYGVGGAFALGVQDASRVGLFDVGRAVGDTMACPDALISQGYAIAASQMRIGSVEYDVAAAETLLRVRERFIKQYGLPRRTIGLGAADAGIALARISQTYPGLDAAGGQGVEAEQRGTSPACSGF